MLNRYPVLVFIMLFAFLNVKAQVSDSLNLKMSYKRAVISTAIIGIGVLISGSQFEKNLQIDLRNKVGNTFESKIDDYTQYAPVAQMYLADVIGLKSKNHWFDQTKYLMITNVITSAITHSLKNLVLKTRPNGSSLSFPSGHTTLVFTSAAVLFNEFHQTAPVLAYSGYAFAATTGTFRMLNNKHWLSDVLVAAGIGIIVTDLVYYFEPLKNFNPFKKTENISLVPYATDNNYGFYFSYKF